jgi:hypothetical protein
MLTAIFSVLLPLLVAEDDGGCISETYYEDDVCVPCFEIAMWEVENEPHNGLTFAQAYEDCSTWR